MPIKCFLIEPTGRAARWLRRYVSGKTTAYDCAGDWHQSFVKIEDAPDTNRCPESPHNDPRWPTACACGYKFQKDDIWQTFLLSLYRMPNGEEVTLHDSPPPGATTAPAGALWFSNWCPGPKKQEAPFLWCMTPGGALGIDGTSSNGPGWTRIGTPPNVTVTPSILITGSYHGFLTSGELIEC